MPKFQRLDQNNKIKCRGEYIMKNKKSKIFLIGSISWLIISILVAFLSTFFIRNVNNEVAEIDPELKMSMQYTRGYK